MIHILERCSPDQHEWSPRRGLKNWRRRSPKAGMRRDLERRLARLEQGQGAGHILRTIRVYVLHRRVAPQSARPGERIVLDWYRDVDFGSWRGSASRRTPSMKVGAVKRILRCRQGIQIFPT
jgi:hypothetical protein